MSMLLSSPWGGTYLYPIKSEIFKTLKIRVSLTNPRSSSFGTRTDTSNRIMGFIHSRNVCQKEVITFNRLWEECTQEEARIIIREEKMGATEDRALTIQRRSFKRRGIWRTQFLKNLLSMLSIWIRNDVVMIEEYDEAQEGVYPWNK